MRSGDTTTQWGYATAYMGDFTASNDFNTILHSFGGEWTDAAGQKAAFNSPEGQAALDWLVTIVRSKQASPLPWPDEWATTAAPMGRGRGFATGGVAMIPSESGELKSIQQAATFRWQAVVPPRRTKLASHSSAGSWYIAKGAPHHAAAGGQPALGLLGDSLSPRELAGQGAPRRSRPHEPAQRIEDLALLLAPPRGALDHVRQGTGMAWPEYPYALFAAECACLEPYLPPPSRRRRPRKPPLRVGLAAGGSVLRTGYQGRLLPREFPPWQTVCHWSHRWRLAGTWAPVHAARREQLWAAVGRDPQPSAGIVDSQAVQTTSISGSWGFGGGKKFSGREHYVLVDTQGLVLWALVHPTDIQDWAAVLSLLDDIAAEPPRLRQVGVD